MNGKKQSGPGIDGLVSDLDGWELTTLARSKEEAGPLVSYFLLVFVAIPLVGLVGFGMACTMLYGDVFMPPKPVRYGMLCVWMALSVLVLALWFPDYLKRRGDLLIRRHADGRWTVKQVYQGKVQRQTSLGANERPKMLSYPPHLHILVVRDERYVVSGLDPRQLSFVNQEIEDELLREIGSRADVPKELEHVRPAWLDATEPYDP